jgi:hypothetical protein
MTMKPSSRELDKHAFDLPIHEARDFQVVSLKQDDDRMHLMHVSRGTL